VTGEGRICAYDIKPSADFEIVNPELHLATLDSPEAKLSVEFYVEQGIGYQPAKHDSDMPIGMVPVDAIFSPIRRVNYKIKPMHVGQETYDRLTLEVKTDGTISPAEAISRGAQILTDQLGIFIGLPEALAKKGEIYQPSVLPDNYTMPVESLGLTTRILNCLRRSNITTVGELAEKSDKELRKLPKLGPKGVEEIRERLRALGATTEDKTNPISLVAADEAKPREEEEVTEEKEAEKEKGGEEA
jgi:DNA-directed RNA polymerase subunit alpha